MSDHNTGRRTASNVLIAAGVIIVLGVAGYFLWDQVQGAQLRARLLATPAPPGTPVPPGTTVPAQTAAQPTASALPPTVPPSPTGAPRAQATSAPVATAEASPPPTAVSSPTAVPSPAAAPTASAARAQAGPPVRLTISELGIDVPVVEMAWEVTQTADGPQTEWVIPQNEAGHHIDSVQLGQPGNLVISGHNNIYGRVFERISLAWPGKSSRVDDVTERADILNGRTIQLYNQAGQRFDYVITDFLRLKDTGQPLAQRIENARFMRPTDDTRLTLVTCWPPWSNTHRLIVIAKPATQS